ncbi:MAG: hypothetical protein H6Q90_2762 [Deltaproteobacteria bacterium]|nr:hypothetical protein [Deltaproteobacteria bacterium]
MLKVAFSPGMSTLGNRSSSSNGVGTIGSSSSSGVTSQFCSVTGFALSGGSRIATSPKLSESGAIAPPSSAKLAVTRVCWTPAWVVVHPSRSLWTPAAEPRFGVTRAVACVIGETIVG